MARERAVVSGLRYRDLFRDREFSGMYAADVVTLLGTYLGRFAVAVLVFDRTDSVAMTAGVFVAVYFPHLFGPWLATLADIFPRKGLLIAADLSRAAIALILVVPGVHYWQILAAVFVIEAIQIPFGAARAGLMADLLDETALAAAFALIGATRQAIQVMGFAASGVIVFATAPIPALYGNAFSFLISGIVMQILIRRRRAAWSDHAGRPSVWRGTNEGLKLVRESEHMVAWFCLLAVGPGLVVVAEALAVPWAEQLGWDARIAALMMSAIALGGVIGLMTYGRFTPERQSRLVYPLAFSTAGAVGLAGLAGWITNHPVPVMGMLLLSGAALSHLVAIQAKISTVVPRHARGRVFGLGNTVMQLSQGAAILIAGAISENLRIDWVLIGLGVFGALSISLIYARDRSRTRVHVDAHA